MNAEMATDTKHSGSSSSDIVENSVRTITETRSRPRETDDGPKHFVYKCTHKIKGYDDIEQNKGIIRLCFMETITSEDTTFYRESDVTIMKESVLKIHGGSYNIIICNISGPPLEVDIVAMQSTTDDFAPDVLTTGIATEDWSPSEGDLAEKYDLSQEISKYKLESYSAIGLMKANKETEILVASYEDRKSVPCFLIILHGVSSDTIAEVSLTNSIQYSIYCEK